MTRLVFALPLLALVAACDPGEADREGAAPQAEASPDAAPAISPAEDLLTRYTAIVHPGEFAPKDDCTNLSGAPEFRRALAQAVVDRDADALASLADPALALDFGGGAGIDTLRARLVDPDYALWDELERLLPLGCAAGEDGSTIIMPHYFAQDLGDRDAFTTFVALGGDVPLRASPAPDGEGLDNVGWQGVQVDGYPDEGAQFTQVTAADGKVGYVERAALRSIVDYRLLANRMDDGWKITALIAGD